MPITVRTKGNFNRTTNYLKKVKSKLRLEILDKYGERGVELLTTATPKDTGETAHSWSYHIVRDDEHNTVSLVFNNANVQTGVNVAILIQYGHATKNGGWVQGRDYINPTLQPMFDQIAQEAWKEVSTI